MAIFVGSRPPDAEIDLSATVSILMSESCRTVRFLLSLPSLPKSGLHLIMASAGVGSAPT